MSNVSQIQDEILFYESREYLPWKVRAGETRALVSLGPLFAKLAKRGFLFKIFC